jgi:hypothetical protein
MAIQIQFRRGTAAEWTAANPILALAEMGVETDTEKFKLGDGSTAWNALSYGGIKGDKGDKGDKGEKGDKGDKGDTGDQGEQGIPGTPGASTFLELTDAPSSYSGQGGKAVAVNSDGTGLEFIAAATPFDPANPGPIGGTTPNTGAFTRLSVAQGTLTDPVAGINLTATWNDAADTMRGLEINVTDTASSASSTFIRAVLNGTSFYEVRKQGEIVFNQAFGLRQNNIRSIWFDNFQVKLRSNSELAWASGSDPTGSADLFLVRGSAATLQLGLNHATTPTAQRIQAHGVTTGTGAPMTIAGGSGSAGRGPVNLEGGQYNIDLTGLPTSDPGVPGRLWRSGTNLHIST